MNQTALRYSASGEIRVAWYRHIDAETRRHGGRREALGRRSAGRLRRPLLRALGAPTYIKDIGDGGAMAAARVTATTSTLERQRLPVFPVSG